MRDELNWGESDLDYVQSLADQLDGVSGIGLINDIEYAQDLSKLLDDFLLALKSGDVAAEIRAEGEVRTLYTDQQMKVYRAEN